MGIDLRIVKMGQPYVGDAMRGTHKPTVAMAFVRRVSTCIQHSVDHPCRAAKQEQILPCCWWRKLNSQLVVARERESSSLQNLKQSSLLEQAAAGPVISVSAAADIPLPDAGHVLLT